MSGICPKCKKILDSLDRKATGIETSRFFIEADWGGTTDNEEFESDGNFEEYSCPECDEVLFYGWTEAEEFLRDKDKLKELIIDKIKKDKENGEMS